MQCDAGFLSSTGGVRILGGLLNPSLASFNVIYAQKLKVLKDNIHKMYIYIYTYMGICVYGLRGGAGFLYHQQYCWVVAKPLVMLHSSRSAMVQRHARSQALMQALTVNTSGCSELLGNAELFGSKEPSVGPTADDRIA